MNYGDRLKSLRTRNNLSQQELADRLKINRSTYARYELSKTQPDFDTLQMLADFYDVTADYLLGRTNDDNGINKQQDEFEDPELDLWFKELKEASPERREELKRFWDFIKDKEKNRKTGDKQGE